MKRRFAARSAWVWSVLAVWSSPLLAQSQVIDIPPTPSEPAPRVADSPPTLLAPRTPGPQFGEPIPTSRTSAPPAAPVAAREQPPESVAAPQAPLANLLTLEQCIDIGMSHQPAIAAANASLNAAQIGQRSVNNLPLYARLIAKDLPYRRDQACNGVYIAEAAVLQAEWETRYSVTRNFFTVQYVRLQQEVLADVLADLAKAKKRATEIFSKGFIDSKITQLDLDAIDIQIAVVQAKKATADTGMAKAQAALREAMGVNHDFVLNLVLTGLPAPTYSLNLDALIADALANRPELSQAHAAARITALEIQAQGRIRNLQGKTFAMSGDIHAKPIPQGVFNNEYRPGAIGIEYPPMLIGRKFDRMERAGAFNDRAQAVVDKTHNLISLDVQAMYLKWREAAEQIANYTEANKKAEPLLEKILIRSQKTPGQFTSGDVINASTTAILVRTQLNEARHNHALALAGLERATGGTFRIVCAPPIVLKK